VTRLFIELIEGIQIRTSQSVALMTPPAGCHAPWPVVLVPTITPRVRNCSQQAQHCHRSPYRRNCAGSGIVPALVEALGQVHIHYPVTLVAAKEQLRFADRPLMERFAARAVSHKLDGWKITVRIGSSRVPQCLLHNAGPERSVSPAAVRLRPGFRQSHSRYRLSAVSALSSFSSDNRPTAPPPGSLRTHSGSPIYSVRTLVALTCLKASLQGLAAHSRRPYRL